MIDMWLDAKEVELVPSQAILILGAFLICCCRISLL